MSISGSPALYCPDIPFEGLGKSGGIVPALSVLLIICCKRSLIDEEIHSRIGYH